MDSAGYGSSMRYTCKCNTYIYSRLENVVSLNKYWFSFRSIHHFI